MDDNANGGHGNQDTGRDGGWIERHLAKIVAAVLTLCLFALIGRALTG
jgi:hypothetical protein